MFSNEQENVGTPVPLLTALQLINRSMDGGGKQGRFVTGGLSQGLDATNHSVQLPPQP